MECSPASAVADAIEMLAGPALLHCVHSRPGAAVAARVLAQGSAKQRKRTIKAMKGADNQLPPICVEQDARLCVGVVTLDFRARHAGTNSAGADERGSTLYGSSDVDSLGYRYRMPL